MNPIAKNGIIYSFANDHAIVGRLQGGGQNAVEAGKSIPEDLSFETSVNGYPVTEIAPSAFSSYRGTVKSITFHDNIKKIGTSAFDVLSQTVTIKFGNNVEEIGERAFANTFYESIFIPASVKYIGFSAFGSNRLLKNITIDPNNKHYVVTPDGCLYNSMKTVLVQTPPSIKNLTLEKTLIEIGPRSILGISSQELILPIMLTIISSNSIRECGQLETVKIYSNVLSIKENAFQSCSKLKNIYYYGTVSIKLHIFDSTIHPEKIITCLSYKSSKFSGFDVTAKEGPCPYINFLFDCTSNGIPQHSKSLLFIYLIVTSN